MTVESKSKFVITTSGSGKNRDKLTRDHYYIALITESFISDEKCLGELRDAKAMKLHMYGLVKYGVYIPKWILKQPWKKLIYFYNKDIENAMQELLQLINKEDSN